LVLDGVDGSEGSPVLGGWGLNGGEGLEGLVLWDTLESEKFFVLRSGPGGHEVVADGEGVGFISVDLSVFSGFGVEEFLSEEEFFGGSVGDTESGDVLEEFLVGFSSGGEKGFEGKHCLFVCLF